MLYAADQFIVNRVAEAAKSPSNEAGSTSFLLHVPYTVVRLLALKGR